ncbi:glycosyltransferase family 2 protein [Algoriphagus formosus]|uniref:glycosyltransferase family 2 protein n=1 Tax=Algoriphagus formosus TaxID=2007308 RepID=UPI000C282A11|nr:glycosyltransferase [Algoriphagus formosus]
MIESRIKNQYPLVSIIIPVYNKALFVGRTLESALGQTYPNTEIILVDDGSIDNSFEILKAYFEKYPDRIVLINQENLGVSAATNRGIVASKGDYIQFLDADDLISPDKIETQIELLYGKGYDSVATCEWVNFEATIEQYNRIPYGVFQNFDSGLDLQLRFWNYQEMMAISSYLTHRDLIKLAGNWNESLIINQDGEFFSRVLLHAEKVLFEPKGKVYYRIPGVGNVSQQKSYSAMKSLLDSYLACEQSVLKVEDSPRIRNSLKKLYQKFIYDVFPNYPDLLAKAEQYMNNQGVNQSTYIGGPKFQRLSRLFGFKNALRLKRILLS